MSVSAEDIVRFCALNIDDEEVERLVGWVAWRTGRNQAMAGSGPALERLAHASANWLDEERRRRLLAWLRARVAQGLRPYPD